MSKKIISHNFYNIDDIMFSQILIERGNNKSIEELANIFQIGINKLRKEFKSRNIEIKRIRK